MDPIIILQAGVTSGTVLLFATLGEIFAERSGVLNLGVEGMMLIGAMSAFSVAIKTGNPWLGVLVAMLVAGLISQVHAFIAIALHPDQVITQDAYLDLGIITIHSGPGFSWLEPQALYTRHPLVDHELKIVLFVFSGDIPGQ